MEKVFILYLFNSVNLALFILLLALLQRILRKHFSAVCLYRIWVILLIGLFIPIRFEFTSPLFNLSIQRISEDNVRQYELGAQTGNTSGNSKSRYVSMEERKLPGDSSLDIQKRSSSLSGRLLSAWLYKVIRSRLILLLWFTGAVLTLAISSFMYFRYKKQLGRYLKPVSQEVIEEALHKLGDGCFRENTLWYGWRLKLLKKAKVCECPVVTSPVTLGILKPVIVLPEKIYTKREMSFLLQHELVHIFQRDSLIKLIRLIVLSLNWYNPLCYVLSRNIDDWCEAACDEIVLHKAARSDCLRYCRLILKCAASQLQQPPALFIHFYGGKKNMKQRLMSIVRQSKRRSGKFLLVLIFVMISTTVFVAVNNQKASATPEGDTWNGSAADQEDTGADTQEQGASDRSDLDSNTSEQSASDTADADNRISEQGKADNAANENVTPEQAADVDAGKAADESGQSMEDSTDREADIVPAASEAVEDISAAPENITDIETLRDSIVDFAKQAEGAAYIWGGNDLSTGVDSSGFVQAVYKNFGYDLPRTSREQLGSSTVVSEDNLLPGDLVFYKGSDTYVNHVAIYIGDAQVIHATNARDGVKISEMNYRPVECGGRYLTD